MSTNWGHFLCSSHTRQHAYCQLCSLLWPCHFISLVRWDEFGKIEGRERERKKERQGDNVNEIEYHRESQHMTGTNTHTTQIKQKKKILTTWMRQHQHHQYKQQHQQQHSGLTIYLVNSHGTRSFSSISWYRTIVEHIG